MRSTFRLPSNSGDASDLAGLFGKMQWPSSAVFAVAVGVSPMRGPRCAGEAVTHTQERGLPL